VKHAGFVGDVSGNKILLRKAEENKLRRRLKQWRS